VTKWGTLNTSRIYAKVGGDMGNYDVTAKVKTYKGRIPDATYDRFIKLAGKSPLSIGVSLLIAVRHFGFRLYPSHR